MPQRDFSWAERKEAAFFLAQAIVLNHPGQIGNDYCPVLDCHTTHIACKFDTLEQKINQHTSKASANATLTVSIAFVYTNATLKIR